MDERKIKNHSKRRQKIKRDLYIIAAAGVLFGVIAICFVWRHQENEAKEAAAKAKIEQSEKKKEPEKREETIKERVERVRSEAVVKGYPKGVIELLDKSEETVGFVEEYEEKKDIPPAKTVGDIKEGEIPLFLQWDERWGYAPYGSSIVAVSGCGPTCMSMVIVGLTGDVTATPAKVAAYGTKKGYLDEENNTYWEFMKEAGKHWGLSCYEGDKSEEQVMAELKAGHPIICSVAPGDFTKNGHFIVLTGIKDGKIKVNDPFRRVTSNQLWEFERIKKQTKAMWVYSLKNNK